MPVIKPTDKEEQELIKKHYLLLAYSTMSEGGEPLENDANLILDNRNPSPDLEESEQVDYFVLHGEMKRYKTKTGMYKGYPMTWLLQVTNEGFKALQDKKYLKEADHLRYETLQAQLTHLQIKEIKTKNNLVYYWCNWRLYLNFYCRNLWERYSNNNTKMAALMNEIKKGIG